MLLFVFAHKAAAVVPLASKVSYTIQECATE